MTEKSEATANWSYLPSAMADAIGVDGVLALVECFGGLEYYVPLRASESHEFVRVIGVERFARLVAKLGGERIAIPRDPNAGAAKSSIMTMGEQGVDDRTIAREVGCTQRYVRRVLESVAKPKAPANPRQTKLRFGDGEY